MSTELSELLRRARLVEESYPLTAEFPLFCVHDPGASGEQVQLLATRRRASTGRDQA